MSLNLTLRKQPDWDITLAVSAFVAIPVGTLSRFLWPLAGQLIARVTGLWQPRYDLFDAAGAHKPPLSPYVDLATALPPQQAAGYMRVARTLGSGKAELRLEVADGLHGPCWEAIVALSLRNRARDRRGPALHFRRVAARKAAVLSPRPELTQVIAWASNTLGTEMLQRVWDPLLGGRGRGFDVQISRAADVREVSKVPAAVRVLHLLGTVQDTNAGLRFRIGGDESVARTQRPPASELRLTAQVGADDIGRIFPNLALCILHVTPGPQITRRDSDRRDAMEMRSFAAELYGQGVPVVIALPPLEPALAVSALQPLITTLQRRQPDGTAAVLRAVGEAQTRIVASAPANDVDADAAVWEAALDLCLYCIDDWDGRLI